MYKKGTYVVYKSEIQIDHTHEINSVGDENTHSIAVLDIETRFHTI